MKIIIAMFFCIIAGILSFVQLQGQIAWKFPRENPYVMMLLGLPISLIFIKTTKLFNEHFSTNWPGRLIGFGVGIMVFTIMSWLVFKEPLTTKTIICLLLSVGIIGVQIFYK